LNDLCKSLDWDSEHFNKRIAQVKIPILYRGDFKKVDHWCIANKIDCLYYLKDLFNSNESDIEESNNFKLIDTRIEFKLKFKKLPTEHQAGRKIQVRSLGNQVKNELLAIADKNIINTRFYNDRNFEPNLVKKMYQIWIKKSCIDPSTTVVIAEYNNRIVGFITFSNDFEGVSAIGLVAIDKDYQRIGIGANIMNECIKFCIKGKKTTLTVATQLNNFPAVKLYEKFGFKVVKESNWYHKWYT